MVRHSFTDHAFTRRTKILAHLPGFHYYLHSSPGPDSG